MRREHVFVVPQVQTPSPERQMMFCKILIICTLQAPSPQPKKGRRKSGLKPKKRESKGDEFLLQNGKQVQQTIVKGFLLLGSGKPENTGRHCGDRGAVQDQGMY